MKYIAYRKGYKYQLAEDYEVTTAIRPPHALITPFLMLATTGKLLIKAGYAWDGPSGPTFDTASSMRCSLVHDALYQLMRQQQLDQSYRPLADDELYKIAIEDGMWKWRAKLWHRELSKFGRPAADPQNAKRVFIAPNKRRFTQ